MHRPSWDQEVIVFTRREAVHKTAIVERLFAPLGGRQIGHHRLRIGTVFHPQIHFGALLCRQNVIAFILGVMHAEMLLDVFRQRVHLEAEVLPADGIQQVKTDREFGAETGVYALAQQGPRV
ncbi:hypothetical protein D3C72_1457330 [compost metagenome]